MVSCERYPRVGRDEIGRKTHQEHKIEPKAHRQDRRQHGTDHGRGTVNRPAQATYSRGKEPALRYLTESDRHEHAQADSERCQYSEGDDDAPHQWKIEQCVRQRCQPQKIEETEGHDRSQKLGIALRRFTTTWLSSAPSPVKTSSDIRVTVNVYVG